jgi:hypothetical protein
MSQPVYTHPLSLFRKLLPLFLLCGCSESVKKTEPASLPVTIAAAAEWRTYEGVVLTDQGTEVTIELSLMEGEVGLDSEYKLFASDFQTDQLSIFNMFHGAYSIMYGASDNELIIQVHEKEPSVSMGKLKLPDPLFHGLNFKSEGVNKLILLDDDFDRVSDDDRYSLYRRSRLFTIEGYVTFEPSRTDFHEQNTGENWSIVPLGVYTTAANQYDSLATEEFEGVYLKALAYSVESDSTEKELLVIKRILEMKKSEAYTDKEKAAFLGN